MLPDDPILRKRPVNATQRLGPGSRAMILALKDVLRALGEDGPVLLGCVCELPQLIAPILRAARDEDAVMVLLPGGLLADSRSRHRFFDLVRSAAEDMGTCRPIVISSGPVEIGPEAEGPREEIHALVDAGFTGLVVSAHEPNLEDGPAVIARACEAALERELGVELLLSPGSEDDAGALNGALKLLDAAPDLVGVIGGVGVGLAMLASEVEPTATSWHEGDDAEDLREALRNAIGAGARMVTVRSLLTRGLVSALPREARDRLGSEVGREDRGSGLEAIAAELESLGGDDLDRVEARVYGEVEDLLTLFRLRGSGRWVHDRL